MSTLVVDTLTGKSTATTITIGSTPVVSASANSMTIRGEGSNQTSIQQGLCKAFVVYGEDTAIDAGSFNIGSLTDVGTGITDHNFTVNFASSESYACSISSIPGTDVAERPRLSGVNTSNTRTVNEEVDTSTDRDADQFHYSAHGDLA
mgnify:CR=1 FL=1|tara:strand:- start:17 stop:460 length:444 start_codon:yes stop_codon:yes gene_type:complete